MVWLAAVIITIKELSTLSVYKCIISNLKGITTFKQAPLQRDKKWNFRSIAVKVTLKGQIRLAKASGSIVIAFLDAVLTIHNKYNGNWLLALKLATLR